MGVGVTREGSQQSGPRRRCGAAAIEPRPSMRVLSSTTKSVHRGCPRIYSEAAILKLNHECLHSEVACFRNSQSIALPSEDMNGEVVEQKVRDSHYLAAELITAYSLRVWTIE